MGYEYETGHTTVWVKPKTGTEEDVVELKKLLRAYPLVEIRFANAAEWGHQGRIRIELNEWASSGHMSDMGVILAYNGYSVSPSDV